MPRQKTGRPVGRQPLYHDDDTRPVTVSLRIPRALATEMKRYASVHHQSVTELLLDGLKWRIGEDEYYSNTKKDDDTIREEDGASVLLERLRFALAREATSFSLIAQAIEQKFIDYGLYEYYFNPARLEGNPKIIDAVFPGVVASNTVIQEQGTPGESNTVTEMVSDAPRETAKVSDTHAESAPATTTYDPAVASARIHALEAQGQSFRQIAHQLSTEGIPTARGGPWNQSSVRYLLKTHGR